MENRVIGIMGAMMEEVDGLIARLTERDEQTIGMRTYYSGKLYGIPTIVVFSRWGKVAAATTVSTLIHHFKITELIFTGVAGALNANLAIGDVVIAKRLIQHDMDARPIVNRFEIPLLGKTFFDSTSENTSVAVKAAEYILEDNKLHTLIGTEDLSQFGIKTPKVYVGDIASGDKFFANSSDKHLLLETLPTLLCVEMEGAAVAQVCYECEIPFTIIRTISDTADETSELNFPLFIKRISSLYSVEIVKNIYQQYSIAISST